LPTDSWMSVIGTATISAIRLMLGYLLAAYTTSIAVGLQIVFTLHGSSVESTSKHTIGATAIGVILLARGVITLL
jgi:hypothetical protein